MQELAAGARTPEQIRELDSAVFKPFERRGRVFVPSAAAFRESGQLLAELAKREGREVVLSNPSLGNDALLATSCRERGITLITSDGDFDRFRPFLG
jgi:predicted nucleic acid-binding protein